MPGAGGGARVSGMSEVSAGTEAFRSARDLLLQLQEDQPAAHKTFRWPRPERFWRQRHMPFPVYGLWLPSPRDWATPPSM